MERPAVRVLVVDDNEAWRRFVRSELEKQPELQVIDEARDGLEAVRKCQELHPDLILLDIGLPVLNGIEAARQIFQLRPKTRILFVSEQRSADIVEAALRTTAGGFVLKSDAAGDLLPAVKSVLQDKAFLSASLAGHNSNVSTNNETAPLKHCHEVAFFRDDASAIDGYARFIESGLNSGNTVVLVATETRRAGVLRKLGQDGVDAVAAIDHGSYIPLDVESALSKIVVNDVPDHGRCAELVGDIMFRASKRVNGSHPRVGFCGEMAPTMLASGNAEAAMEIERIWDQIARKHKAVILCGYSWDGIPGKEGNPIFQKLCAEHTAVHRG